MKFIKTLVAAATLLTLAACGEEEGSAENYVGRWVAQHGNSIMEISDIGNSRVEIDHLTLTFGTRSTQTLHGRIEDGLMIVGEDMFAQSFRYDEQTNRIKAPNNTYRPVPAGWTWRDGYEMLED